MSVHQMRWPTGSHKTPSPSVFPTEIISMSSALLVVVMRCDYRATVAYYIQIGCARLNVRQKVIAMDRISRRSILKLGGLTVASAFAGRVARAAGAAPVAPLMKPADRAGV